MTGIGFLVALRAGDHFGLGSASRGLLLASFGLAGMVLGRPAGMAVDRRGRIPVAVAGALATSAVIASIGLAGSGASLALLWLAAGAGSAFVWAGLNTLAVEAVPANRAGATSVFGAFKFAGSAVAPMLWLPLYQGNAQLAFLAPATATAAVAVLCLTLRAGPGLR